MKKLLYLIAALFVTSSLSAQLFDDYFGNNGAVIEDLTEQSEAFYLLLPQTDGKVIAGGVSDNQVVIARYNEDGSIDTDFGSNGYIPSIPGLYASGRLLPDGSFFILTGQNLYRYLSNGTLDASFANNGVARDIFCSQDPALCQQYTFINGSLTLEPSGKIGVRIDASLNGSPTCGFIFRLNNNGNTEWNISLPCVGSNGLLTFMHGRYINLYNNTQYYDRLVLSQIDTMGNLIVDPIGNIWTEIKLGLDCDIPTSNCERNYPKRLKSAPNNKLMLTGFAARNDYTFIYLARLNLDNTLDASFGSNGSIAHIVPGVSGNNTYHATDAYFLEDGKILFVYSLNHGIDVARMNADGSMDNTFGQGGFATFKRNTPYGPNPFVPYMVAIQSTGKYLVAGRIYDAQWTWEDNMGIARLDPKSVTTGIFLPQSEVAFSIYPNPSQGFVTLQLPYKEAVQSIWITGVNGSEMKRWGEVTFPLDVSNLSPGLYFLHVQLADGRKGVQKLVVQ